MEKLGDLKLCRSVHALRRSGSSGDGLDLDTNIIFCDCSVEFQCCATAYAHSCASPIWALTNVDDVGRLWIDDRQYRGPECQGGNENQKTLSFSQRFLAGLDESVDEPNPRHPDVDRHGRGNAEAIKNAPSCSQSVCLASATFKILVENPRAPATGWS